LEIALNKKDNNEASIKISLTESDYQPKVEKRLRNTLKKPKLKVLEKEKCL